MTNIDHIKTIKQDEIIRFYTSIRPPYTLATASLRALVKLRSNQPLTSFVFIFSMRVDR